MIARTLSALTLILAASTAARAQDHALTPTDLLEFGQVAATARLQLAEGNADLTRDPVVDMDVDLTTYQFQLDAAVGLGMNFEVEMSIPYQFVGTVEAEGDFGAPNVETEEEDSGFGDLQTSLNYRLLKEDKVNPQWLIGFIVIAPTGNDKRGEAEVTIGNVTSDGDEGGIGKGVWSYGVATAISTRLGLAEPYAAVSYIFGGDRDRNGVDEERADVGTLLVGAEFHVTPQATLDFRALVQFVGDDVTEDNLVEKEAEAHTVWSAQGSLYVAIAPMATLVFGGGVTVPEDHEIDTMTGLELEGTFIYFLQVGLHLKLGL